MTDARRNIPGKLPGWMIADEKSNRRFDVMTLMRSTSAQARRRIRKNLPNALSGFFHEEP
jgi:hypothetical protein